MWALQLCVCSVPNVQLSSVAVVVCGGLRRRRQDSAAQHSAAQTDRKLAQISRQAAPQERTDRRRLTRQHRCPPPLSPALCFGSAPAPLLALCGAVESRPSGLVGFARTRSFSTRYEEWRMQLVPPTPCPCVGAVACVRSPCAWQGRVILPSACLRDGRGSRPEQPQTEEQGKQQDEHDVACM
jgi:hypothetical protein